LDLPGPRRDRGRRCVSRRFPGPADHRPGGLRDLAVEPRGRLLQRCAQRAVSGQPRLTGRVTRVAPPVAGKCMRASARWVQPSRPGCEWWWGAGLGGGGTGRGPWPSGRTVIVALRWVFLAPSPTRAGPPPVWLLITWLISPSSSERGSAPPPARSTVRGGSAT